METLVKLDGVPEQIMAELLQKGYFKTKTEAFRAGLLGLGKEYGIPGRISKELELELVARKIIQEKEEMKRKGERYLSEDEAMKKYWERRGKKNGTKTVEN